MADWLIFKLSEDATGSGELEESVVSQLKKPHDKVEKAAKQALAALKSKVVPTVSANGVRLMDASPQEAEAVAAALEKALESVGVCEVKNNEWWELSVFRENRLPLG